MVYTPGLNSEVSGQWWLGSMYLIHMANFSVDKEMILTKSIKEGTGYSGSYIRAKYRYSVDTDLTDSHSASVLSVYTCT